EGIYQPNGGVIDAAATKWSLLEHAAGLGCVLRPNEPIIDLSLDGSGVTIRTHANEYRAGHVVVTAGGWTPELLGHLGVRMDLTVYELTKAFFRVGRQGDFPTWFAFQQPVDTDSNLFYGFGRAPWASTDLVQVSPLFEQSPLGTPGDVTGLPREHDLRRVTEWVRDHMPSLVPEPLYPGTCVAALPTDH